VLLEQKNELNVANENQIAQLYNPKIAKLNQKIIGLKSEINAKELETNALYDTYISEAEGKSGTKLLGKGPVYNEKRDKHDASLLELQQLKEANSQKISELEAQIAGLQSSFDNQVSASQPIIDGFDGLM